jgi:hypothetical protein
MATRQQRAAAIHESGHAVAVWALDLPRTIRITLGAGEGEVKRRPMPLSIFDAVEFGEPLTGRQWRRIEAELTATYAGSVAETRFRGRASHVGAGRVSGGFLPGSDYDWLAEWGIRIFSTDRERLNWFGKLRQSAEDIIGRHWASVEALADILLERQSISGCAPRFNDERVSAIYLAVRAREAA